MKRQPTSHLPAPAVLRPLWRRLGVGQKVTLVLVSLGNTVAAISVVLPSVMIGRIVTALTNDRSSAIGAQIAALAGLLGLFVVLKMVIHIGLHRVLPRVEATLRQAQLERTLKTPVWGQSAQNQYAAELNSLMGKGAKAGADVVKVVFADLMPAAMQAVVAAVTAFTTQWGVAVVLLVAGVVSTLITQLQLRSQGGVRVAINRAKARLDGVMTELLRGKPVIRTLNAVDAESKRVGDTAWQLSGTEIRHHQVMGLFDAAKTAWESLGALVVLIVAARFVVAGAQAGVVLTLYLLFMQFAAPLRDIHRIRDELNEASLQLGEVFRLLAAPLDKAFTYRLDLPTKCPPSASLRSGTSRGPRAASTTRLNHHSPRNQVKLGVRPTADAGLVVSAVSITYPNGHPGVRQASLAAPAGSYLGICGPAGCGKSTLVKALVGIVAPQTGTITLGGVEVGQMAASDLADTIAYVSQEPYVISGTVRDNLLLGQPDHLPDLRLAEALDQVGLLAELGGVAGLDAVVGEDGQGLSGGQRQRLVLARILLRQAQVIVLDEATSALDNLNEEQVMHALEASGRTVIAIAHRLSTLRRADQIVVMRDGQIVERGTYPTLDAAGGLFHSLLHAGETDLPPDGTTVSPRVGVSRRNCAEPAIPEWVGHSRPAHPLST